MSAAWFFLCLSACTLFYNHVPSLTLENQHIFATRLIYFHIVPFFYADRHHQETYCAVLACVPRPHHFASTCNPHLVQRLFFVNASLLTSDAFVVLLAWCMSHHSTFALPDFFDFLDIFSLINSSEKQCGIFASSSYSRRRCHLLDSSPCFASQRISFLFLSREIQPHSPVSLALCDC